MQTFTLNVQEGFVEHFLTIIRNHKDQIELHEESHLAYDPYFTQRKAKLEERLKAMDSGKMRMLSQEESNKQIDKLFERLENENNKE